MARSSRQALDFSDPRVAQLRWLGMKRGFIQRWFDKMIDSAADQYLGQNQDRGLANAVISEKQYRAQIKSQEFNINTEPMRFSVYRANGGFVIETQFQRGDRNQIRTISDERSAYKLHIINDDKDLGHELGKIITLESLRG